MFPGRHKAIAYFDISTLPTDFERFSFTDSVCVYVFLEDDSLVLCSLVREEVSQVLHWEAVWRHCYRTLSSQSGPLSCGVWTIATWITRLYLKRNAVWKLKGAFVIFLPRNLINYIQCLELPITYIPEKNERDGKRRGSRTLKHALVQFSCACAMPVL